MNVHLLGISVDLVSMRGADPSPVVDAQHRDLTINAMFYNINSKQVEDPTGFGLVDLKNGLLRAAHPDPVFTLRYDPLRAVRVMRFKASTRYALDPALLAAMSQPALGEQLLVATKRDRIGQELKKAFGNPAHDLAGAIELLAQTGLFGPVLLGVGSESQMPHREMSVRASKRMGLLQQGLSSTLLLLPSLVGLVLATCFWELKVGRPGDRVKESEVYAAIVGGLRLSHQDAEAAVIIIRGAIRLRELVVLPVVSRLQLGLCLRMCGPLWSGAWLLAVAADENFGRLSLFEDLKRQVDELQLDGVWTMKPLLNGNEISKVLGIAPGPVFAVLTEKLIEEQLKRPSLTVDEAKEFLVNYFKKDMNH